MYAFLAIRFSSPLEFYHYRHRMTAATGAHSVRAMNELTIFYYYYYYSLFTRIGIQTIGFTLVWLMQFNRKMKTIPAMCIVIICFNILSTENE